MFLFILIHLHLAHKNVVFKEVVDGQELLFSLFDFSLLLHLLLFLSFTSTSFLSVSLFRKKK